MKVRFQYTDFTEWEGPPEDAGLSPNKGVVRMYAIDDFGRRVEFVYDDFYYLRPVGNGKWLFGSGTPKREFTLVPGVEGTESVEVLFPVPADSVVRKGETISQEDAVAFGLIETIDGKRLSHKAPVSVIIG